MIQSYNTAYYFFGYTSEDLDKHNFLHFLFLPLLKKNAFAVAPVKKLSDFLSLFHLDVLFILIDSLNFNVLKKFLTSNDGQRLILEGPPIILISKGLLPDEKITFYNLGITSIYYLPLFSEFPLQIRATIKLYNRRRSLKETEIKIGLFTFNTISGALRKKGDTSLVACFTPRLIKLFTCLLTYKGLPIKVPDLIKAVWGFDNKLLARELQDCIAKIRGYLKEDKSLKIEYDSPTKSYILDD